LLEGRADRLLYSRAPSEFIGHSGYGRG
jgi:hypothetical protein